VHACEFCHIQFTPRNQVKNPRACLAEKCQTLRQRDNEKTWKQKHLAQYDKEYHEIQRDKRSREVEAILKSVLDCLRTGISFFNLNVKIGQFEANFTPFFLGLGIREINKFWDVDNPLKSNTFLGVVT
jgi:hypothetical protein